jgi:hypothetical protein
VRRLAAVTGLVLLGISLVVVYWLRTQRDVTVELVHPDVPAERWNAYMKAVSAARDPAKALAPVVAAFEHVNRVEVAAVAALGEAAWQYAQRRSTEELLDLGRRRGLLLASRLDTYLEECARRRVEPGASLGGDDVATRAYVDAGGAFVRFAEHGGFIEGGKLRADRLPLMQALFVHHWVGLLNARIDLHDYVRADEREWLLRWRVEWQTGVPLERRLAAADALRRVKSYPADLNAGVLLYLAGRRAEAARRLEGLTSPRAVSYRRMALRDGEMP